MKSKALLLVLLLLGSAVSSVSAQATDPVLSIEGGKIRGVTTEAPGGAAWPGPTRCLP